MTALVDGRLRLVCARPSCDAPTAFDVAFCEPCWGDLPTGVQRAVNQSKRRQYLNDHLDFVGKVGQRLDAGEGLGPQLVRM